MSGTDVRQRGGSHVVVLGGSLAGLCAAAALAPLVDHVTLVERDRYPEGPEWRRGVPQARHTHNLMLGGQRALDRLLPGVLGELRARGMVEVRMPLDMRLLVAGGWVDRFPSRHVVLSGSRDLLDWVVRREVRKLPNVRIMEETEAVGLLDGERPGGTGRARSVRGVLLRERGGGNASGDEGSGGSHWREPYPYEADFVVAATGRGTRVPSWLADLGHEAPQEDVVDAGCAYATCVFEPPPSHAQDDWKCILLQSTAQEPRSGILNPIEGGRWMVSVAGLGGERPPLDHQGFVDFAKRLRSTALYEAVRDAEPVGKVHGSGRTENRWRRYERMPEWPDRFLPVGDAVGAFNPAYGQGISVAALSALELRAAFRAAGARPGSPLPGGLAGPLRKRIAKRVSEAWTLSGNADMAYEGAVDGPLPLPARLGMRFTNRLLRVATTDRTVAGALFDMTHLIAPPQTVLSPRVLAGVLRGPGQGRAAGEGAPRARSGKEFV